MAVSYADMVSSQSSERPLQPSRVEPVNYDSGAATSPRAADEAARWRDDPIDDVCSDRLGRSKFAMNSAHLINDTHSDSSSVVYGLEGPWGSGKSSVNCEEPVSAQ